MTFCPAASSGCHSKRALSKMSPAGHPAGIRSLRSGFRNGPARHVRCKRSGIRSRSQIRSMSGRPLEWSGYGRRARMIELRPAIRGGHGEGHFHQPDHSRGLPFIERIWDLLRIPDLLQRHRGPGASGTQSLVPNSKRMAGWCNISKGQRFEWHPELAAGQNVMLADLGGIYFNAHEDATLG